LDCANQTAVLKSWTERNGFKPEECEFFTEVMSTRKTRPVKADLINRFRKGEFGTIVVTRIDRFARSSVELVQDIHAVVDAGGRFVSVMNGFDFQKGSLNASQMLMLQIFAAFAEFEREIIRERTLEGLARVKALGKHLGRPFGSKKKVAPVPEVPKKIVSFPTEFGQVSFESKKESVETKEEAVK
jgi:DNA invertase Pin-like site-specific DNA recombinase